MADLIMAPISLRIYNKVYLVKFFLLFLISKKAWPVNWPKPQLISENFVSV